MTRAAAATALCFLALGTASAIAAPPTVQKTSLSHVTTESALLEAEIVPGEKAKPRYHFEYGPADCASNPCTSTFEGKLEQGEAAVEVSAQIEGLTPKTTYHFRVVAENNDGEAPGPDRTFTTFALPFIGLPDGRAYEQASPVDKNGLDVRGKVVWVKASVNGDAVSFLSAGVMPGGEGGQDLGSYLSSRDASGWSTHGLLPPAGYGAEASPIGWTPDFSTVFSRAREHVAGVGDTTLIARSGASGPIATIVPYGQGLSNPAFAGTSADGSLVLFESEGKLASTPAAIKGESNLYLYDATTEAITLAGVMNDGQAPPGGAFAGPYDWYEGETPLRLSQGGAANGYYLDSHALSTSGSVYFTAGDTGQLYLRKNPTKAQSPLDGEGKCTDPSLACTVHVSATQRSVPDPLGARPAAFQAASADGSVALFTSAEELTDDANTGPDQEPPMIARAEIDGAPLDVGFIPATALGVAVDATHLYWADPVKDTIGRATLDGTTEVDPDFIEGADNPQGVAVSATHVYWTNAGEEEAGEGTVPGTGSIGRAKLGPGGGAEEVEQEFIPGIVDKGEPTEKVNVKNPQGIDVDATHVFWVNAGTGSEFKNGFGNVARANIVDGSSVEAEFIPFASGDVAVNATHVYSSRSNGSDGFIRRAKKLDGSSIESISTAEGAEVAPALALDGAHIYWTNAAASAIGRDELDGKDPKPAFIKPAGKPKGLAADATHLYFSANQDVLPNPGNDLYRYEAKTGELTDLAPDTTNEDGAEVQGILGASADASHVYFAANGVPDGVVGSPNARGESAVPGNCQGILSGKGECNLYLAREGMPVTFIARLRADGGEKVSDARNWLPRGFNLFQHEEKTARVSPDGQTLLFRSQRQLSDYENEGAPQLYRYRVGDPGPTCVSCSPAIAGADGITFGSINLVFLNPNGNPTPRLSRNLSADGNRVFFETTAALLASDTNGEEGCPLKGSVVSAAPACLDVYEWEAEGTGSCEEDVIGGGCLYLLSTGKSPEASFFADASASGDDAFIITRSAGLVGQDQDQLYDVFDARVGGGLASQNEAALVPCEAEGCKPASSAPPVSESAGTASFSGPGNPKAGKAKPRCPKSKRRVRSKGRIRCVAKGRKNHKRAKTTGRASR